MPEFVWLCTYAESHKCSDKLGGHDVYKEMGKEGYHKNSTSMQKQTLKPV